MRQSIPLPSQDQARSVAHAPGFAAFLLCLGFFSTAVCAQPVAVVTDRAGEVSMDRAGAPQPVALLEVLNVGSRLKLANASRLALLFMQTGHQYTVDGPGLVEVGATQLVALAGAAPVLHLPPTGTEFRLRPGRVALGGIVLRSMKPSDPAAGDGAKPTQLSDTAAVPRKEVASATDAEIEQHRPHPGASFATRVAFALWLDDVGATAEARQAWRALSEERPDDAVLVRRAQ
jgi:hypothetical protein